MITPLVRILGASLLAVGLLLPSAVSAQDPLDDVIINLVADQSFETGQGWTFGGSVSPHCSVVTCDIPLFMPEFGDGLHWLRFGDVDEALTQSASTHFTLPRAAYDVSLGAAVDIVGDQSDQASLTVAIDDVVVGNVDLTDTYEGFIVVSLGSVSAGEHTLSLAFSKGVSAGQVSVVHMDSVDLTGYLTTRPDAPRTVQADAGVGRAVVHFVPPLFDGASPITGYTATCTSTNGGTTNQASGTGSPITVTGLTIGKVYTCTATATNDLGTGASSDPSDPFLTAFVPGAPTIAKVTREGATSLVVRVKAPSSDGGFPVTRYRVECKSTKFVMRSVSTKTTTATVTKLTKGQTYRCYAAAVNKLGQGDWSPASAPIKVR